MMRIPPIEGREASQRMSASIDEADYMGDSDSTGADGNDDPESMEAGFFKGKRPWSKIKDKILGQYMPPYLAKVATLGKPIILVDAFAGPGKFEDDSAGSTLIICQAAEQRVRDSYQAIFVNREKEHHDQLSHVLSSFIEQKKVIPIHGTADALLTQVRGLLRDHTVFLYLDPFGLKGCEFSVIEPFLRRDRAYSTEIVLNLSIPTMHRLAARKAVAGDAHANGTRGGVGMRKEKGPTLGERIAPSWGAVQPPG